jgi:Predicted transcriptional regulator
MDSSLIDLVFRSDKRKNLLILLDSGSKNIDEIRNALDVTSTSILPPLLSRKIRCINSQLWESL